MREAFEPGQALNAVPITHSFFTNEHCNMPLLREASAILMKQVNTSGHIAAEKPAESAPPERGGATASSSHETFGGAAIDFHSPEFNRTDDLNDMSGNSRFFEPLDGIVTADMRHQMERPREESCFDSPARDAPVSRGKKIKIK